METFDPFLFEISSKIKAAVRTPPPTYTEICKLITQIGKDTSELDDALSFLHKEIHNGMESDEVKKRKGESILVVIEVMLSDTIQPDYVKNLLKTSWPEWGVAWLLLAEIYIFEKDYVKGLECFENADKCLPIAYYRFTNLLGNFRTVFNGEVEEKKVGIKVAKKTNLLVSEILARHKPNITNFADFADTARKFDSKGPYQKNAVLRFLSLFGPDPGTWISPDISKYYTEKLYGEFIKAGAMCAHINIINAKEVIGDYEHDFEFWNRQAIAFHKEALVHFIKDPDIEYRRPPAFYAIERMVEAYTNIVKNDPMLIPEIWEDIQNIEKLTISLSKEYPNIIYQSSRRFSRIYQARAIFLYETGGKETEIDISVKKAIAYKRTVIGNAIKNTHREQFSFEDEFRKDLYFFLVRVNRLDAEFDSIKSIFQESDNDILKAEILSRRGGAKQAVKQLISKFDDNIMSDMIIERYCITLHRYITKNICLPDALKKKAYNIINDKKYFLIDRWKDNMVDAKEGADHRKIKNAIRNAYNCLAVIEWLDEQNDQRGFIAQNYHKRGRTNLAAVKNKQMSPEQAVNYLLEIFNSEPKLKADLYLRSLFLQTCALQSSILPPEDLLPMKLDSFRDVDTVDYYDCFNILRYHMSAGHLQEWADNYLYAVKKYHNDQPIKKLLRHLWDKHNMDAQPILREIFSRVLLDRELLTYLFPVLNEIPGDFLFVDATGFSLLQSIASDIEDIEHKREAFRLVISALSRGQYASWHDPSEIEQRTLSAAKWLYETSPKDLETWVQWIGSARGDLYRAITREMEIMVNELATHLEDPSLTGDQWKEKIQLFLKRTSACQSTDETVHNIQWDQLENYCAASFFSYNPSSPDSSYWPKFQDYFRSWFQSLPSEVENEIYGRAWLMLQQAMRQRMMKDTHDVVNARIHDFKNILPKIISQVERDNFAETIKTTKEQIKNYRQLSISRCDLSQILADAAFNKPFTHITRPLPVDWTNKPRLYVVRCHQGGNVTVNADKGLLVEAVRALLMNAWDDAPGWVWAEVFHEGGRGGIRISSNRNPDQGMIPDNLLEYLNNPFSYEPRTGKKHGSGYGVRMCHRIIKQQHGGDLRYTRVKGDIGLQVDFHLPVA